MEAVTLTPEQVRSAIFRFADRNYLHISGPHEPVSATARYGMVHGRKFWHWRLTAPAKSENIYPYMEPITRFMAGMYPGHQVHFVIDPLDFDTTVHVLVGAGES